MKEGGRKRKRETEGGRGREERTLVSPTIFFWQGEAYNVGANMM